MAWVAVGDGAVWATNEIAGHVYRIDPNTNRAQVVNRIAAPAAVAADKGAAWVAAGSPPAADVALPTSVCGQILSGGQANPRFLIVSDLPLQGSDIATTHQMVEAIQLVLKRRHYQAGPYTVGYQSCDDSTSQGGSVDDIRCYTNANAYARNPDVIGIIGSRLRLLATGDPDSQPGPERAARDDQPGQHGHGHARLVRGDTSPEDLQHLYPTGKRNFVRTPANDRLSAIALVQFAKEKGIKRLYLTWDRNVPVRGGTRSRRANGRSAPRTRDRRRRPLQPRGKELQTVRPTDRVDPRRRRLASGT